MVSLKRLPCSILLLWHRTLLFGFALWRFGLCFYPGTSPVTLLVPHGFFGIVDSNLELSGKCGSFVDVHSVLWILSAVVYTLILSSLLKLITHGPVSPLDSGVGMGGDWGFLDSCKADFGILRSTGIPVIQRAHSAVPLYLPSTETFLPVEQNSYHNGQTQNTEKKLPFALTGIFIWKFKNLWHIQFWAFRFWLQGVYVNNFSDLWVK